MNKLSTILTRCMGDPEVAEKIHRYPFKPDKMIRYTKYAKCVITIIINSEIYHGSQWHYDEKYKVHMTEVNGYHVYVGDIVEFVHPEHGMHMAKVLCFFEMVTSISYNYIMVPIS